MIPVRRAARSPQKPPVGVTGTGRLQAAIRLPFLLREFFAFFHVIRPWRHNLIDALLLASMRSPAAWSILPRISRVKNYRSTTKLPRTDQDAEELVAERVTIVSADKKSTGRVCSCCHASQIYALVAMGLFQVGTFLCLLPFLPRQPPLPPPPSTPLLNTTLRLRATLPLAWLHIPKAGSSFGNILYHHPEICPYFPENVSFGMDGIQHEDHFLTMYHRDQLCPGSFSPAYLPPAPHHQHDPFGNAYEATIGKAFTMIREPRQRVIADWYDTLEHGRPPIEHGRPIDAPAFAIRTRGLVVRMLTRNGSIRAVPHEPCTTNEVRSAMSRLDTFAFVGITDHWQLSVCLFHAMFGGAVRASDLINARPGDYASSKRHGAYDVALLRGVQDEADFAVYTRALEIFERNLQAFNVTEQGCERMANDARRRSRA